MLKNTLSMFAVAGGIFRDIFNVFRAQALTRGYLLALTLFLLTLIFGFVAFNPVLYSFVYPLF